MKDMLCFTLFFLVATEPFLLSAESAETRRWIYFLEHTRADQTRGALANAQHYVPRFKEIFREEKAPEDLVWLALIESSFRERPTSVSKAQGMFQFKAKTARAFGLRVDRRLDERNQPDKAARACARYLIYLYNKFKNWDLVLAAYNLGEGDLRRAMARHHARTWLQVKPHVRRQTREYVGKIKAAAVIGNAHMENSDTSGWTKLHKYRVKKGDNLYQLSKKFGVALDDFRNANGLKVNSTIFPGQILVVPDGSAQ